MKSLRTPASYQPSEAARPPKASAAPPIGAKIRPFAKMKSAVGDPVSGSAFGCNLPEADFAFLGPLWRVERDAAISVGPVLA